MSQQQRLAIERVGVIYRERSDDAEALARSLVSQLHHLRRDAWRAERADEDDILSLVADTQLVIVLGGDGTILSVARFCAPLGIPILAVNFGRVGFLTELEPGEVEEKLPLYLAGEYWLDERSMLQAELGQEAGYRRYIALNDIVLVRGAEPRVVRIAVWVDGHHYNTTVADGIIISTATGSTAYNLAAGGPILHPQVRSSVLTPIAPHLAADRSLILEPNAVITLDVEESSAAAVLSADGQLNCDIAPGTQVTVRSNAHMTGFLRRRPPTYFYKVLAAKLRDSL